MPALGKTSFSPLSLPPGAGMMGAMGDGGTRAPRGIARSVAPAVMFGTAAVAAAWSGCGTGTDGDLLIPITSPLGGKSDANSTGRGGFDSGSTTFDAGFGGFTSGGGRTVSDDGGGAFGSTDRPPLSQLFTVANVPRTSSPTVRDLCSPCSDHAQCGGPDDFCIVNVDTFDRFCAQACRNGHCDPGYSCEVLDGPNGPAECVPADGTCPGRGTTGTSDAGTAFFSLSPQQMASIALDRLNALRAAVPVTPLNEDSCLDGTAQTGAEWFASGGPQYGYFRQTCGAPDGYCTCGRQAEIQDVGPAPSSTLTFEQAIDAILLNILARGPTDPEARSLDSTSFTRAGAAVVRQNDQLELTVDFGSP